MKLTQQERDHAVWGKISAYAEDRLKLLRASNDNDHDATQTASIRGQIKELKALLNIAVDAPDIKAPRKVSPGGY